MIVTSGAGQLTLGVVPYGGSLFTILGHIGAKDIVARLHYTKKPKVSDAFVSVTTELGVLCLRADNTR